ncbi:MAG TPA: DUF58 domain-containing protein [Methylocystis sp.]|nr:DUF58 domain-containing protein [Methylocystis sp.]
MIRPTQRAALLFAAVETPALLLMVMREELWPLSVGLAALVLLLIGVDALLGTPAGSVRVSTTAPSRLPVGSSGEILFAIFGPPGAGVTIFEALAEQSGDIGPPRAVFARTDSDGRAVAQLALDVARRGVVHLDAVWLRWRGPLGLAERILRAPIGKSIDVIPDVRGVRAVALQFNARESLYGIKAQQQKGEGAEFESLREHAPGLDNRFIDWKRSARHRRLLSKEFRTERNHHVILAFDTGHLMAEPIEGLTRLDHAINAGLLLSYVCLRSGDLVGVYGFDARVRQFVQPGRGLSWYPKLQRGVGALAYQTVETNFTLGLAELNARLSRRALIVLFTEFVDETTAELLIESLHGVAKRHSIVFVTLRDPQLGWLFNAPPARFVAAAEAVVAYDFLREKAIVLERLERLGVHCLETSARGLSTRLINRYLTMKERGLI